MMGKSVKEGIMPKEFIHCRDFGRSFPVVLDGSGGDPKVEMMTSETDAIKVGWSKESEHVEVAVVQMVDGMFVEHGFEGVLEAGVAETTDLEEQLRIARLTPRYIQLDRAGLNRFIRILRQARDDAFGRDE